MVLGAVAKLQKATASSVMHPSQPARTTVLIEHLGCNWLNVHGIWYLSIEYFSKISPEYSNLINI
jgi:hypothetical protein